MFCWQLTVGVDGAPKVLALKVEVMVAGLVAEMMDPLFEAEVAASGGNVVLNWDVMLVCPVSLFPRLGEGVVVGGAGIKGKKDDESGGVTVFELGMRGKIDA